MKIISAKVIVTCPGRNLVTLKIMTDEGVHGLGDATLNGREKAVVAYLEDHVIPCLIGRDPHRIEDIWQYLYKGAYWRRGPVTMTAIAAVDTALWDIKGKVAGLPLYELLGGKSRDGVMVYCHANGRDVAETIDSVAAHMAQGYRAIRAQSGVPGLDKVYGIPKGGQAYEPAEKGLPTESIWSTEKYLDFAPKLFERLREKFGFDFHLLHDVHHRLTPIEAARLGKALEPCRMFWMEDPTPAENQDAFRLIRQHTVTPIAVGEVFNSIWDCRDLIQNQLIDYIRTTVVHAGGISHLRKIAALHFDMAVANFGIQEHMPHTAETDAVFPHAYTYKDGFMLPGNAPGHGVEIDEALAAKYPYDPAYLPVARLEDGTLASW
jgi:mannonate dehydratase